MTNSTIVADLTIIMIMMWGSSEFVDVLPIWMHRYRGLEEENQRLHKELEEAKAMSTRSRAFRVREA